MPTVCLIWTLVGHTHISNLKAPARVYCGRNAHIASSLVVYVPSEITAIYLLSNVMHSAHRIYDVVSHGL